MPKYPRMKKQKKHELSKHRILEVQHFAYQYNEFKDELRYKYDTSKALTMSDMPMAHNYESDTTADAAIECAKLRHKIEMIEKCARVADPALYEYILENATNEHKTYEYLKMHANMPCSHNTFYQRRRDFYWLLSQELKADEKY